MNGEWFSRPLQSPSVYSGYRRQALEHTIRSVCRVGGEPVYFYGDFNFRLDFSAVVKVHVCDSALQ